MSDKTQLATFRIEPELWEAFKSQARKNGKTASDVLTDFVQTYVEGGSAITPAETLQLDNLDCRIDEKVGEAIAPIMEEVEMRLAKLEYNRELPTVESLPIDALRLGERTFNTLKRNQINTIADLMQYSEKELKEFKNLGDKGLQEVLESLRLFRVQLSEGKSEDESFCSAA